MAVIRVFDSVGVRELPLDGSFAGDVPYIETEEEDSAPEDTEAEQ